jgi:hypothetical protein
VAALFLNGFFRFAFGTEEPAAQWRTLEGGASWAFAHLDVLIGFWNTHSH